LLDVIYQLRVRFGVDLPLVIVGEGKEHNSLVIKAARLSIRLFAPGFLENPYPLIKGAKILAVTSNYESFHLGIIEAMACGTPVISVNCAGGISGLIRTEENGILVEPGDKDGFAAAIVRILSDKELARKITGNAQSMAEKKYNIELMISKYESLLR
jgi:glycosyltransferase involved in cell wall biosynthesis